MFKASVRLSSIAVTMALLSSVAILTGCQTVTQNLSHASPEARMQVLTFAAARGPVLMRAVNAPFPEGDDQVSTVTAEHATGSVPGRDVRFTADKYAAAKPNYYVVLAFDPPPGADSNDLCQVATRPLPYGRRPGEQWIQAAFCASGSELGGVTLRMPAPKGLGDPAYKAAVEAVVFNLFDASDNTPRGKRGGLGVLGASTSDGFGIRVNPLEGIFD
jgi:hypothetical protein